MPELAEVEAVRLQIESHLQKLRIREVEIDVDDRILFQFTSAKKFQAALTGARIVGTGRRGKYFWLELNRKPWPVFHLGMSGNIAFLDPRANQKDGTKIQGHQKVWGGAKLWSAKDEDLREQLAFCRLLLRLDKGLEMAFIDPRRFGRVWLTDDVAEFPRIKKLGFDPLIDFLSVAQLSERLAKRKKAIKSVLLDQSLFAGIGNWLADEILFQAKINPHRLASDLTPPQLKQLHKQVLNVTKKAVAVKADYERFPKTWLFHDRWGKGKGAEKSKATLKRNIQFDEIGGRTTAWIPKVQK